MKITDTHVYFWHGPFSNWHICKLVDELGNVFENSEQAFMYKKALFFNDFETSELILKEPDPHSVKKLGRAIKGFNKFQWAIACFPAMVDVNNLKYQQNEDLKQFLIETGDRILVEASPYDKIWGVGLREDDKRILDTKQWKGSNLLGKALIKVRKNLKF